jgi:hypothetical protein
VKNKENIFEELNKMKNLMRAKAGTVISEQADMGYDIATIKAELDNFNSDEQKIVDILKNYKDKASFQNFVNQYKTKIGKDFGVDIFRAIQPYNDKTEWNDLKNHLSSMGITLGNTSQDPRKGANAATFTGLDTPATPATRTPEAMKNITSTFCGVRGGKITAGAFKGQPWTNYKSKYNVTDAEEQEAKKSCPTVQPGSTSSPSGPSVNTRFADSVKSLGIENGKMDLQTLQTMLKSLEGETTTAAAPTQGTPDLAQLTAALNQLNA